MVVSQGFAFSKLIMNTEDVMYVLLPYHIMIQNIFYHLQREKVVSNIQMNEIKTLRVAFVTRDQQFLRHIDSQVAFLK